jgi:hypothetical protein
MATRDEIKQELDRWFSFPADRPTADQLDQIVFEILAFEEASEKALSYFDVERIVVACVPSTRVPRFDGLNFQDLGALLALIRLQAKPNK